jgi:PBSX family phage terminase large subunit
MSAKEGWLFGRHILLEGANDAQAESKIRGVTLQGAYVDEATKLPHDFWVMLLSRLRKPGAKLIATTNPDAPGHWLKSEYIDRSDELNLLDLTFTLDDNTTLPKEYVDNIKKEYTGVFYDRFILGLWVLSEGIIYPMYEEAIAEPPEGKASAYCLSIDYGTQNAFAALMWGNYDGVWYAVDEYYYSGRKKGIQKTDEEYAQDIDAFVKPYTDGRLETIIDPSAASFITALQKRGGYRVRHAINDVADGIRETATALKKGLIRISPKCENWKKESQGYVWDDCVEGDKPIKENDHCLVGETLVNTKNGAKQIFELVGTSDEVWSYNTETGVAELKPYHDCRLTQEKAEIYEIETEDGRFIRCTGEHPILTERGYVLAKDLLVSDRILNIMDSLDYVGINSIRKMGRADVYNMEVEDNHNFAVEGGLIVHNCMDSMRYFVKTKHIAIPKRQMPGAARTVLL